MFYPPPPSARARKLSRELQSTVDDYRRGHPETTDMEVRQALHLAAATLVPSRYRVVVGLAFATVLMVLGWSVAYLAG